MNTDLIEKEWQRAKKMLHVEELENDLKEQKKWFLLGLSYAMARFSEIADEMTEDEGEDFYQNLLIESQFIIMELDEEDDGEGWQNGLKIK